MDKVMERVSVSQNGNAVTTANAKPLHLLSPQKRIKVLHLITRLSIGGAQENTMLTAGFLDKDRFDVEVWCGPQCDEGDSLLAEFNRLGIKLAVLPELVREVNPVKDAVALAKLARRIKKSKFDVVHTHSSKAGIIGRLAAAAAGVPAIVHTVHGWSFHDWMNPLARRVYIGLEKMVEPKTQKLITVSDRDTRKGLVAGVGSSDKYTTIHSGIEVWRFSDGASDPNSIRSELGLAPDTLIVGTVSRLAPQKNPSAFVRMAAELHKRFPDVHFLYVGDGPLRPEIEKEIQEHGLESHLHLLGARRDIPEITHAIDIFVLTSLWEGLPRVFPQAMAAGKPIVATRVDGAPEAIEDAKNGYLVEVHDHKTLVDRVGGLIQNPNLRLEFGARGRDRVYPDFCATRMTEQISDVYDQILIGKQHSKA
ncbi:MAG: glycosyltransferase family 4 protein [Candidatus Eisenbacteria bacterium]|uniref:Glycosyltransferase family 4 protein n=1 Tax=Eiseniibacteriota bacterium TaxID=2212470 RepID=A0A7Y2H2X8_UNCEI|nr:glycosyltransferase family 4 protein [Candidatus Eisenbacteria bacterium]